MMSKGVSVLVFVAFMSMVPVFSAAQVTPPPGGQRQRLELERRLQQGFHRSIQNQLGFDQAKMIAVQGVMQSFQEERQVLNRAQASLRFRLRDPALKDMPEEEARGFLQEMVNLQRQELELYQKEQDELLKILTPVELILFYRAREDLGQRVQQLRQGRGQGGGTGVLGTRRGGGGTGGRSLR